MVGLARRLGPDSAYRSTHIDAEANVLLHSNKTVCVFDGSDRGVLPEQELEAFYASNLNGACYKEDQQAKARTIDNRRSGGSDYPLPHRALRRGATWAKPHSCRGWSG